MGLYVNIWVFIANFRSQVLRFKRWIEERRCELGIRVGRKWAFACGKEAWIHAWKGGRYEDRVLGDEDL